jgi:hypothetical protein
VNDVGSTKGDIAKYTEVVRHKIKTVGAIKNDGARMCRQVATGENVVDSFVQTPGWIDVVITT